MKGIGIQLDPATGDLFVRNGSLATGNITVQNQAAIIGSYAGAFKLSPTVGVGIGDALLDDDPLRWRTDISAQLRADGQQVKSIMIAANTIVVDSKYAE